jgi:hypothetical protein
MYILTISGQEEEGAYAVEDDYGDKTLFLFQDEDDAERYAMQLEADDFPEMDVVEVDPELAISMCTKYNYRYSIISTNELVIPHYDSVQDDPLEKLPEHGE